MSAVTQPDLLPELHVAAGVLIDTSGNVLLAQRTDGRHMAGAWEFPGGKIAAGETPLAGLVRELDEELGIKVRYARYLMRYVHAYPDRKVWLYIWKVLRWRGTPSGLEGQPLEWLKPSQLMAFGLLPADERIALALQANARVNTLDWTAPAGAVLLSADG